MVSVPLDGLKFYELVEVLRENLRKQGDLLDVSQLNNNPALFQEVLDDTYYLERIKQTFGLFYVALKTSQHFNFDVTYYVSKE